MKSLAELEAIRQKTLENIAMRKEVHDSARVVVGMATCGIGWTRICPRCLMPSAHCSSRAAAASWTM